MSRAATKRRRKTPPPPLATKKELGENVRAIVCRHAQDPHKPSQRNAEPSDGSDQYRPGDWREVFEQRVKWLLEFANEHCGETVSLLEVTIATLGKGSTYKPTLTERKATLAVIEAAQQQSPISLVNQHTVYFGNALEEEN